MKSTALFLFFFLSWGEIQAAETIRFVSSDSELIATNVYATSNPQKKESLLIVAPGFAQNKITMATHNLCQALVAYGDVVCVDFRGTGESSGVYKFGEKEYLDLEPILNWANTRYKKVYLLGLSLGAYSSVRAAYYWPEKIYKMLLISCPSSLEDIIFGGGIFAESFFVMLHLFDPKLQEIHTGLDWMFRWGFFLADKPNLSSIGEKIRVPAAFLVGAEDHLVSDALSKKVYDALAGKKDYTIMPEGEHAESMFLQNPSGFLRWVESEL